MVVLYGTVYDLGLNRVIEIDQAMDPGKTRLREPAGRLWLAMAVATLWTVTVGSDQQQHLSDTLKELQSPQYLDNEKSKLKKVNRTISCFLQGLINIIANLLCDKGIFLNDLFPQLSFAVNTS